MKTITSATAFTALSLLLSVPLFSQETNKNVARSYHSRGMSIFFSPVYTSPMDKGADSLLFRGSGAGMKFGGDYFFGNVGLGLVSGFSSSAADDALINDFLKRNSIPQDLLVINKSSQQNMYLLVGPSLRWGKSVQLFAHAKGGLFINNGGLVNIQQKGAQRSIYRNEATTKSIYPGFQTGVSIQYSNKSETWSFGFGADYMSTKTQMQNFDLRRGGGVEGLQLSRNISDLMAGISIRYTIKSPRDAASGLATGRRTRDAASGLATGRRTRDAASGLATGRRTRDAASGLPTGRRSAGIVTEEVTITDVVEMPEPGSNCGPVTQRVTNPDGSTSEMTFACPDDAAAYQRKISSDMPNRISMNRMAPKQTQGSTFGEKVNAGLHAAGGALAQGRNIISGKISWASEGSTGIVTNKTVAKLAGGPGGAAAASYASTGMTVSNPSPGIGSVLTLYSREAGSGMASGRRDKGSGMATGRRQYQPFYREGSGNACDTCSTTVRLSNVQNNPYFASNELAGEIVQTTNGHNNPAFTESQMAGTMAKTSGQPDQDCDGLAGVDVYLKDPYSGAVLAKTTTTACGDFFFANVPDGDYMVVLAAAFLSKKSYDMYNALATDMRGRLETSPGALQLFLNTGGKEEESVQKAGISTSRSNIRNKTLTIIEADTDGDGEYEALRANATFSDGSSADISSSIKKSSVSGASPSLTIDEAGTQRRRVEVLKSNKTGDPNANRLTGIIVTGKGAALRATATFSDGSSSDITESLEVNNAHNGVRQYSVMVTDVDGDGHADAVLKTRTKSNQTNERMAANAEEEIWSPRSNIKTIPVTTGDLDGDGEAELIGGTLPGGAVISAAVSRQAGGPIGGIIVKGGKNPGGQMRTLTTDENGEFEFTGLEAGSYTFTVEQKLIINDETFVSVGSSRAQDHNSSRSNKTASGVAPDPGGNGGGSGGSKAQDHNSTRSNKTASIAAPDPGSGGGGSGGSKAQDHNSTRSNKTASVIDNELNNGDGSFRKGDVKVTASQNTQSLRTISVQADLDGDGIYETDVSSRISDELILDKDGNLTEPQQKTGINTSRSNIRNRSSLQPVTQTIFTGYGTTTINGKEVEVKTVYKVVEKATSGLKDTLKTQV